MIGPHFCLEEWVKPSLSTSFNQGYPPAISLGKFGIFLGGRKNPLWQCVTLPETNSNFAPENGSGAFPCCSFRGNSRIKSWSKMLQSRDDDQHILGSRETRKRRRQNPNSEVGRRLDQSFKAMNFHQSNQSNIPRNQPTQPNPPKLTKRQVQPTLL